ncbi:hypothetical protein QBC43DRAFT_263170 [Cladorrhinum sp. PSN259]|nr:hypothetical protein QBC43DRAFT_263170 [Cladorrhinum sp. PSN259]
MSGVEDFLYNNPIIAPPPGHVSDFVNRSSRGPIVEVVLAVFLVPMIIFVLLRLYVRFIIMRKPGADDFLLIAAALCMIADAGVVFYSVRKDGGILGIHSWNVRLSEITPATVETSVALSCLYTVCGLLLRCSLLVFYFRLFNISRLASFMIWGAMVFIIVADLTFIILKIVFCNPQQWPSGNNPIEYLLAQESSMCTNPHIKLVVAEGAVAMFSDIYILAIPIMMVRQLQLSPQKKLGMYSLFLLGAIATAASVATTYVRALQLNTQDYSYMAANNVMFGALELELGILCACIPVAIVVLRRINPFVSDVGNYFKRMSKRNGYTFGREKASWPPPTAAERSFIGRLGSGSRTNVNTDVSDSSTAQITKMSTLTTYSEVGSAEEEYHRGLRPPPAASASPINIDVGTAQLDGRGPSRIMRAVNDRQV